MVDSFEAYQSLRHELREEYQRRARHQRSLLSREQRFTVEGFCYPCWQPRDFQVDYRFAYEVDGVLTPNWREHLICPSCGLNNRMRASIHLFEEFFEPPQDTAIFITEQIPPAYQWLAKKYTNVVGSEYLGEQVPLGEHNRQGLRNEDLTALTFPAESFDFVISFDVFEHIPNFHDGLRECFRVLKPGGILFFTVPFIPQERKNTVRAVVKESGEIEHLMPPDYHYNPIDEEGSLAFYHFGWELLDNLRAEGYSEVKAHVVWSQQFAYLGSDQLIFTASKAPGAGKSARGLELLAKLREALLRRLGFDPPVSVPSHPDAGDGLLTPGRPRSPRRTVHGAPRHESR